MSGTKGGGGGGGQGGGRGSSTTRQLNVVPIGQDEMQILKADDFKQFDRFGDESAEMNPDIISQIGVNPQKYEKMRELERQWVSGSDGQAKAQAANMLLSSKKLRLLSLHDAYVYDLNHRLTKKTFSEWGQEPVTLYRGGGVSGSAPSFARTRSVAEDAGGQGNALVAVTIPRSRVLNYTLSGSGEVWVHNSVFQ